MPVNHVTLRAGDLTAVVGNNAGRGRHLAGYNGLWRLSHRAQPGNLFVPAYAGFNLEHLLNGATGRSRETFFEPRLAPMTLRPIDQCTAELHQPPTPLTGVESWTRFELAPPDTIRFGFRAIPRAERFPHGFLDVFWASYINGPEDKSMYVRGGRCGEQSPTLWRQFCTPVHGHGSTLCRRGHAAPLPRPVPVEGGLMNALSPLGWDEPLFYGRWRGMTLLVMFDADESLRLAHSPSGGGLAAAGDDTNPAWDFQWVISRPRVGQEYELRAEAIFRPAMTRSAMLRELERFGQHRGVRP